jgi:hypothetical protein
MKRIVCGGLRLKKNTRALTHSTQEFNRQVLQVLLQDRGLT